MKRLLPIILFFIYGGLYAQEFIRPLPDTALLAKINIVNFPNMDAVIILKEQSVDVSYGSIYYRGGDFVGSSVTTTNVKIVKLFNEAAVKRYGTFEMRYRERFGDEIPCGYMARARVLKQTGKVEILEENAIKRIVEVSSPGGTPLVRKLMFTVPNLEPGDVLQFETQLNEPLAYSNGGIFFYNDRDYVLFSNVNITLPAKQEYDIYSFPMEKIGAPSVKQLSKDFGSGETHFWSVKNLNAIPDEAFSRPFEDEAMMTCFVIKEKGRFDESTWPNLIERYYDHYFDVKKASASMCVSLGLPEENEITSIEKVDSLYERLKSYFKFASSNSVYPNEEISDFIEAKKADATDAAYLMLKILKRWGQACDIALIRDKRAGVWEKTVPSLSWFDRVGLVVNINGTEKFYDFDFSIPNKYENPWFLNNVDLYIIKKGEGLVKNMSFSTKPADNMMREEHNLNIENDKTLTDKLKLTYSGYMAQKFREENYKSENLAIKENYKSELGKKMFAEIETVAINNFLNESKCEMSFSGKLKNKIDEVDSFIVAKNSNLLFYKFRDKIFSSVRKKDIILPAPLSYKLINKIKVPEGYALKSGLVNKSVSSTFNANINIESKLENGILSISYELVFNQTEINAKYYRDLINFIDKAITESGKDIVFKKVN